MASGKAVELMNPARTYELAVPGTAFFGFFGGLYPTYVRGQAHLAGHQTADVAGEFEKLLSHPGIIFSDPIKALVHLQLGKTFKLAADAGIPIFKQAKAEYLKR